MASQPPIHDIRRPCHLYMGAAPNTVFAVYVTISVLNTLVPLINWSLIVSLKIKRCPKTILRYLLRYKIVRFHIKILFPAICLCLWIFEGFVLSAALACRHDGFVDIFYGIIPRGAWIIYGLQGLAILYTWFCVVRVLNREMRRYRIRRGESEGDAQASSTEVAQSSISTEERAPLGTNVMPPGQAPDRSGSSIRASSRPTHFYWEGIDAVIHPDPIATIGNGTVSSHRGHYPEYANPDLASRRLRRNYRRLTSEVTKADCLHQTRVPLPIQGNGEGSSKAVEQAAAKLNSLAADEQGFPFPPTPGPETTLPQDCPKEDVKYASSSRKGPTHLKPNILKIHQDRHRRMSRRLDKKATPHTPVRPSPLRVQSAPTSDTESIDLETETETIRGRSRRRFALFPFSRKPDKELVFEMMPMSKKAPNGPRTTCSSSASSLERNGLVPHPEDLFIERTQPTISDPATTQSPSPSIESLEHVASEAMQPSSVPGTQPTTRSPSVSPSIMPFETTLPTTTIRITRSTTWPPKISITPSENQLARSKPDSEAPTQSPSPSMEPLEQSPVQKPRSDSGVGVDFK